MRRKKNKVSRDFELENKAVKMIKSTDPEMSNLGKEIMRGYITRKRFNLMKEDTLFQKRGVSFDKKLRKTLSRLLWTKD